MIDHVTSAHYFKDEGLFYIFNEEQIYCKCKLIKHGKYRSKSNHYCNPPNLMESASNVTMIQKSSSALNINKKKKKSKKKLKNKIKDKDGKNNPNSTYIRSYTMDKEKSLKLHEWRILKIFGDVLSDSEMIHQVTTRGNNNK